MTQVLKQADRCDRCGAQAFVQVEAVAGPLLFCGHHYERHSDALFLSGYSVIDERLDGRKNTV